MHTRHIATASAIGLMFSASVAFAWTGPTQTAPAGNVSAPINVGATDQVKSASIGVNGLAVFGNSLLQSSSYLNWGGTAGWTGYGIRDNNGVIEFKNNAGTGVGTWYPFATGTVSVSSPGTARYAAIFSGPGSLMNSIIYDTGSNVGIGTGANPTGKLEVRHTQGTDTELLRLRGYLSTWGSKSYLTFVDDGTGLVESQIKTELINGSPEIKRTLTLGTKENLDTLNIYNGGVAIGTRVPTAKLTVGTAGSAGNAYYDIGAAKIAAGTSIYSYGSICAGNANGDCSGLGGVILTAAGAITASGNVTAAGYFHSSDRRLKNNIQTSGGMDLVSKLRGVTFTWKKDGTPSSGLIAQEVEQVLPSAVKTDSQGMKSVEYDALIAPLIEAVKEQQAEIDFLKHEITILKGSQ